MTFTAAVPISGDSLGGTRDRIRTNFQEIANVVGVNHVAFNSAGEGKHKYVEMPVTTVPATLATEGTLYTKAAGQTQLFYTSDAGAQEYQLTRAIDANIATFGLATNGWTFLPGGLIMKYGLFTGVTSSFATFTPAGPAFTSIPDVIILTVSTSSSSTDAGAVWNSASTNQVQVRLTDSSGSRSVSYTIIGK